MFFQVPFGAKTLRFANEASVIRQVHQIIGENLYHPVTAGRSFALKSTDRVVDIGANVGIFSIAASTIVRHVYAYEPVESNFSLLCRHQQENGVTNLTIHKKAVSDYQKAIDIYLSSKNTMGHTFHAAKLLREENEEASLKEPVDCISLRQVFEENALHFCDFLKIDCEGEEYTILESLTLDELHRIDRIACEYHYVPGKSIWSLVERLSAAGYFVALHQRRPHFGQIYAIRDLQ